MAMACHLIGTGNSKVMLLERVGGESESSENN